MSTFNAGESVTHSASHTLYSKTISLLCSSTFLTSLHDEMPRARKVSHNLVIKVSCMEAMSGISSFLCIQPSDFATQRYSCYVNTQLQCTVPAYKARVSTALPLKVRMPSYQFNTCFQNGWPPLWSSGQSSWLQSGDVLCFLSGMNWIYICYVEESRLPL
jgi:hypothetical protein